MTTHRGSGYWGLFKNQQDESFCNYLIIFHAFRPYLPASLQGGGCWPGMLGQKVGSIIAAWLLTINCPRHHQPVSLVHPPASISSQLPGLQDLPHFRDLSSSQELHLLLFRPSSFFQDHFFPALLIFWHTKTHFSSSLNSFHA